jgi:site-specific recombinase XerD
MTEKGYENSSQNSILASLHSYFNYCLEEGLINTDPMKKIGYKRVDEKLKVDVDVTDLDQMELAAECYRDAVMMHFMLFTMLRVSEVAKANITDIKYNSVADKYYLEVYNELKGKEPRIVPIPSSKESKGTLELLNDYIAKRKPLNANEKAIFLTHDGERLYKGTIGHMIKATREKAGIQKKITPHAFRRGGARLLYERGTDILTLQKVLGHKHLNQTQKYIQTTQKFITEQYAVGSGRLMQEIHSIDPDNYKNSRREKK